MPEPNPEMSVHLSPTFQFFSKTDNFNQQTPLYKIQAKKQDQSFFLFCHIFVKFAQALYIYFINSSDYPVPDA